MTADGGTTPVHEEWRAEVEDDRFLIRGTRLSGEETQEFHWIFTFNASTELFDCEYWHTGIESELNFEVSLSDDKAELRTALGDSGGELLVSNSMKENSIVGLVTITNGNGEVFPVASIIHTKEKE